jgi:methylmalonyl-CoA mutase
VARSKEIKATRDDAAVEKALAASPLLPRRRQPAGGQHCRRSRLRATVGEISDAMEKVFGRFVATTQCISGVYAAEYENSDRVPGPAQADRRFLEKDRPPAAHPGDQNGPGRP